MEEFKEAFAKMAIRYTEYVENRIAAESNVKTKTTNNDCTELQTSSLMDEVRAANVVAVTLSRMEAMEKGMTFGVNARI